MFHFRKRIHGHAVVSRYTAPLSQARGESRLFDLFAGHRGRQIQKWDHYLDLYDRHFAPFENPRFLEIGVEGGGSLEMWRSYFGPGATIFGIDIHPDCLGNVDPPNQVRIGSQDDPAFLRRLVAEMGGLDIVLDDGSHIASHQETSFKTLFPLLNDGGVYAIEDLSTSYWKDWQGGYRRKGSAIELIKCLIDDLHQWWHDEPVNEPNIGAIHVHDSIVFIEKAAPRQPKLIWVANPDFPD